MSSPERTPEEIVAEFNDFMAWYKGLSDEFKNGVFFRWERLGDKDVEQLCSIIRLAEKAHRSERSAQKKAAKKENYERRSEPA